MLPTCPASWMIPGAERRMPSVSTWKLSLMAYLTTAWPTAKLDVFPDLIRDWRILRQRGGEVDLSLDQAEHVQARRQFGRHELTQRGHGLVPGPSDRGHQRFSKVGG